MFVCNGTSVLITPSGVLFSTSAYSVGTRFVAMCSSGTIVLTDGDAYGLSLGSDTRTLGACDLIELILRPAYGTMNRLWNEINFVNGDDD